MEIPKPVTLFERYVINRFGTEIRSVMEVHPDYYRKQGPLGPAKFLKDVMIVAMSKKGEKPDIGSNPTTPEYVSAVNKLARELARFGKSASVLEKSAQITKGLEKMAELWEKGMPGDMEKRIAAAKLAALRPVKVAGEPKLAENYIYHFTMRAARGGAKHEWAVTDIYQITSARPLSLLDLDRAFKRGEAAVAQLGVKSVVNLTYTKIDDLKKALISNPYRDLAGLKDAVLNPEGLSSYDFKQIYPKPKKA